MKLSKPILALFAGTIFMLGIAVGARLIPRDMAEDLVEDVVAAAADDDSADDGES